MAVDVKRKQNESVEGLIRRFSQRVLQSRLIFNAKAKQHYQKKKTKRQIKNSALRRNYNRARRAYLIKTGQLQDDTQSQTPGRANYPKK